MTNDTHSPIDGPPVEELTQSFQVYEIEVESDRLLYYGEPLLDPDVVTKRLWPVFREHGYEVTLTTRRGEHVLVATPRSIGVDGIPWTNVLFAALTLLSTLYAGTQWYYVELNSPLDLLAGWPFALAVLGVLGVHELGHYVLSRYHGVDATLPYFIPFPNFIGTMGAVIRMRGRMPDRKALFDIGVAGPLAGLIAAIGVTVVGLYLPPITVPRAVLNHPAAIRIEFHYPLLLQGLAALTGQPLEYADPTRALNPVVFGGWVGMFVTFLNLIPVGQLDGGHLLRAMVGKRQETIAATIPLVLFALAGYLYFVRGSGSNAAYLWAFWGLFTIAIAYGGPANPIQDEPLDRKRIGLGVLTFVLGIVSFTPIPFEIIT